MAVEPAIAQLVNLITEAIMTGEDVALPPALRALNNTIQQRLDQMEQRLTARMDRSDALLPMRLTNAVAVGDTPIHYPAETPPAVLATLPLTKRAASSMTGENARLALINLGEKPIPGGTPDQHTAQFWDFIGLVI